MRAARIFHGILDEEAPAAPLHPKPGHKLNYILLAVYELLVGTKENIFRPLNQSMSVNKKPKEKMSLVARPSHAHRGGRVVLEVGVGALVSEQLTRGAVAAGSSLGPSANSGLPHSQSIEKSLTEKITLSLLENDLKTLVRQIYM